jgi:hypothetical protein
MRIGGTFNGTAATVYLCIGFVPDWVKLWNAEGTQALQVEWNKNMRASEIIDGVQLATSTFSALTTGNGIKPYYGGVTLSATDAGVTTYGEGVYLKKDVRDYRKATNANLGIIGDAVAVDIDTWTLDATTAGHFNEDVTGTYIGEGSPICIDGKWYVITALTASQGEAASEVTLNVSGVPSGAVQFIGGMYDYVPMVAGDVTLKGFVCSANTVNANTNLIAFEAGTYDQ